jgi:hypothetical protein
MRLTQEHGIGGAGAARLAPRWGNVLTKLAVLPNLRPGSA